MKGAPGQQPSKENGSTSQWVTPGKYIRAEALNANQYDEWAYKRSKPPIHSLIGFLVISFTGMLFADKTQSSSVVGPSERLDIQVTGSSVALKVLRTLRVSAKRDGVTCDLAINHDLNEAFFGCPFKYPQENISARVPLDIHVVHLEMNYNNEAGEVASGVKIRVDKVLAAFVRDVKQIDGVTAVRVCSLPFRFDNKSGLCSGREL